MFYYYGGKAGRAKLYPHPRYPTIVEPFAGAAGYSMHLARILPHARDRVEVVHGDYRDAPDLEATWLVDPPYQVPQDLAGGSARGDGYGPHGAKDLDFEELGSWCRARKGQTIVCEASGANWLPFEPLYGMNDTIGTRRVEVLWTNEPTTLFGAHT